MPQFASLTVRWLATVLIVTTIAGCNRTSNSQSGQPKRIIFLTNGDDPYWDAAREGLKLAAEELDLATDGYRAIQDRGDFTIQRQIEKLNQYASSTDVAAVAVCVIDPNNRQLIKIMRNLRESGVKVIAVDSDVNRQQFRDARFAYLGTDNILAGQELGKAALGVRPDGGKYATFVGNKEAANSVERITGFAQGAGPKFEQLDSLGDGGDEAVAQDRVRAALDSHPELDTLVGIWAYNAHAIVKLVKERNRRDKTSIFVFDARAKALDHIEDGDIDAMIVQNPYQMGYLSVKLLKALLDEDQQAIAEVLPDYDPASQSFHSENGDILDTELRLVVPDEGSPLTPEMFDPRTRFFHLHEFRQWLAERNLTDS